MDSRPTAIIRTIQMKKSKDQDSLFFAEIRPADLVLDHLVEALAHDLLSYTSSKHAELVKTPTVKDNLFHCWRAFQSSDKIKIYVLTKKSKTGERSISAFVKINDKESEIVLAANPRQVLGIIAMKLERIDVLFCYNFHSRHEYFFLIPAD
jgi:hypothetical protein